MDVTIELVRAGFAPQTLADTATPRVLCWYGALQRSHARQTQRDAAAIGAAFDAKAAAKLADQAHTAPPSSTP